MKIKMKNLTKKSKEINFEDCCNDFPSDDVLSIPAINRKRCIEIKDVATGTIYEITAFSDKELRLTTEETLRIICKGEIRSGYDIIKQQCRSGLAIWGKRFFNKMA